MAPTPAGSPPWRAACRAAGCSMGARWGGAGGGQPRWLEGGEGFRAADPHLGQWSPLPHASPPARLLPGVPPVTPLLLVSCVCSAGSATARLPTSQSSGRATARQSRSTPSSCARARPASSEWRGRGTGVRVVGCGGGRVHLGQLPWPFHPLAPCPCSPFPSLPDPLLHPCPP